MVWDQRAAGNRVIGNVRARAGGGAALAVVLALASCGGHGGGNVSAGCDGGGTGMCAQVNPDAAPVDATTLLDADQMREASAAPDAQDVAPPDAGAVVDAVQPADAGSGPPVHDAGTPPDASPPADAPGVDVPPTLDAAPDLAGDAPDSGPASGADFTNYLANAAHTNFVDDATLVPPLVPLWTAALGQNLSYPLIAGDLVYVSLIPDETVGVRVVALDRLTGKTAWSAVLPAAKAAFLAYENGRLFASEVGDALGPIQANAMHPTPTLWAFDGKTGAVDWQVPVDAARPFRGTPPLAYGGTLYSLGDPEKGTPMMYAYDEATGAVRWMSPFADGTFAASADGVFTFDSCGTTTALNLDGTPKWGAAGAADAGSCYPFGTAVIQAHAIYETPDRAPNVCIDARTGATQGTFPAGHAPPVFGAGLELDMTGQSAAMGLPAQGTVAATGAGAWTFTAEGGLFAPPLVAGATVYVGSQIGTLSAIDPATGRVLWSQNAGVPFTSGGMAAAHGVLVVSSGTSLIAYGPGTPANGGVHDYGSKPGCAWSLAHQPVEGGAASPEAMAVSDFNKDGKPDIVLAAFGLNNGGGLNVMLGKGDGTFEQLDEASDFPYGTYRLVAGDVDGDGVADVVSAGGSGTSDGYNIKVSLGKGDGTFKAPTNYTVGMAPMALALADLDGNGRADLVVADSVDGVRVLLNQGKGTFGSPVRYSAGNDVNAVAVGDVDGDGKPDLALAIQEPASMQILLGSGNGTFGAPLTTTLDYGAGAFALADVDGDHKLDVVAAVADIEILAGKGDGTFAPAVTTPAGGSATGVAAGDLDLDGKTDLVITNYRPGTARVLFGAGDGTFHGRAVYGLQDGCDTPIIADFNGDGLPDITVLDPFDDTAALLMGACAAAP